MPTVSRACLRAISLAFVTLAAHAAAPPGDKQQPAPVPAPPPADIRVAPRFQPAPVPGRTDSTVRLSAPVAPPYAGTAYRDLGGQPETSADAIASQGAHPR